MIDKQNNQRDRAAGRIVDDLDRLGRALNQERFPGAAWRRPSWQARRTILRIVWPAVATTAAAVVLLAVVIFHSPKPRTRHPVSHNPIVRTLPVQTYSDAPVEWSVPTDLDPGVATCMTFDVPPFDLSTATGSDGTGQDDPTEWSLPGLSLPAMPDEDSGAQQLNNV